MTWTATVFVAELARAFKRVALVVVKQAGPVHKRRGLVRSEELQETGAKR